MIDFEAIVAARQRLAANLVFTPCTQSLPFSRLTGLAAYLKLENLQATGSFKDRGSLNKMLQLSDAERARGVIAASAGNHGQSVAYHAKRLGLKATIVMPENAPMIKILSTREHGAEVVLRGFGYDDAFAEASARQQRDGLTFIHAFDDDEVIAGQGTVGLELLEQVPELEAVVVPVGGGGLIAGIAIAVKHKRPGIKVIGVQTQRVPSASASLSAGAPVTLAPALTLADGIAVRRTGDRTLPVLASHVDEIVTVSEDEIANAILLLLEREKTVAEGAGAVAVAAAVNQRTSLPLGCKTALLVCGGNIDVNILARVIERGLGKDGRRLKLEIRINDAPGSLHALLGVFAQARASVLEVMHQRTFGVDLGDTLVDVTLETRGPVHVTELLASLSAAGYVHRRLLS
ncbi:MAG: threonine ammonia-lyase [Myxococcales bacterium]|nr:threonine ammonia-lyase [Myxococcales bacterium]